MPFRFSDPAYEATLTAHDVELILPNQYLDTWRLDASGVRSIPNDAMRDRFDFPAAPAANVAALAARTAVRCCCDEHRGGVGGTRRGPVGERSGTGARQGG
jgi:hypothetical protein